MSHTVKAWHALFGLVLIAACDGGPAGPSLEGGVDAYAAASPASADVVGRTGTERGVRPERARPDVDKRRLSERRHHRLQAAARQAIDHAKELYARVDELVQRDDRPAVKEALAEARQLIDQAIDAYGNGDYNRALIKAQNAIELLEKIVRYLG
jgi:hypothetical protein